MTEIKTTLDLYPGEKKTLLLPGGYKVIIREQNAKDDEKLSNVLLTKDNNNINSFITDIIVHNDLTGGKQTLQDTIDMRLKDKYYVLIASRVFSLSNILKFSFDWGVPGKPEVQYEEDLSTYIPDYNKEMPKPGAKNYNKFAITPYAEKQTKPGVMSKMIVTKNCEYEVDFLNGHSEAALMQLTDVDFNINSELMARNFRKVSGEPVDFSLISSREMIEIRKQLKEVDDKFDGITEIQNPYNGQIKPILLLSLTDFFYPTEI